MLDATLVTGTSGLIGRRVAEMLAKDGVDVLGVDVRPAAAGAAYRHVVADAADLDAMSRLMRGRPNVVHAGAVSGPMLMRDEPFGVAHANIGGAMAVFEAAYRHQVRRLVWLSSIAVYGDQPTLDPVTEATAQLPRSFYGCTKQAGEALLRGYVAHYGLDAVALRLSSVFGPRRQTACALRELIEAGLDGRHVTTAADDTSYRQYVHIDDAARSVVLALALPPKHQFAYNITGGSYVAEAVIARMVAERLPGLSITQGPAAWNEGHLGPLVIAAAECDLGYKPQVILADGIDELHRYIATRQAGRLASK